MATALRPQGVVFDMDGLLLNTESLRMQALDDCARELGVALRTELFTALVGGATPDARKALEAHVRDDLPKDFWTLYRRFADVRMAAVEPMPGALALLDHLRDRDIPCAIATSATRASVERFCGKFELLPRFGAVIAKGDYEKAKPAPDAYIAAAAGLGVSPADCRWRSCGFALPPALRPSWRRTCAAAVEMRARHAVDDHGARRPAGDRRNAARRTAMRRLYRERDRPDRSSSAL